MACVISEAPPALQVDCRFQPGRVVEPEYVFGEDVDVEAGSYLIDRTPVDTPGRTAFRVLAFFLPIAASIGVVILVLYYWDRHHERSLRELDAEQSVRLQTEMIKRDLKSVESDLLYLANQDILKAFMSGQTPEGRKRLEEDYLLFSLKIGLFDQIRCLDSSGLEVVRVNYNFGEPTVVPVDQLQNKRDRYYFQDTIQFDRDDVYLSRFDLNMEHGDIEIPFKPVLRMATPIFDREGRKAGVLVLNYLGEKLIQKIVESSSAASGLAMLINREGFWLHGLKPDDEWGFMLGNDRVFDNEYPEAWEQMASHSQGQFITKHGLFTFKEISLLPSRKRAGNDDTQPAVGAQRRSAMTVVSLIPEVMLYRHSNQLLGKLLLVYVVVISFLLGLILLLARARAVRRNAQYSLQQSEGRLRVLTRVLLSTQEDERRNISRELHDDLGQRITAICVDLERALQSEREMARESFTMRALEESRRILDRVKEFSLRLRPQILDDLGLRDAVQSHLSEFENRTGIDTDVLLTLPDADIPHNISENIFRILQEALNNVSKYASSERVCVRLVASFDRIELTVRDEGVGFAEDAVADRSLGILGMRERAELLGGTFSISSQEAIGTEVKAAIPIPTPAQA